MLNPSKDVSANACSKNGDKRGTRIGISSFQARRRQACGVAWRVGEFGTAEKII
jgi:hypothetical protein